MPYARVGDDRIEYVRLAASRARPGSPTIVFLHEGLGSVSAWGGFPQRVADDTGCEAVVYSRRGYGRSTALAGPRDARYLHDEAQRVLPALLRALGVERPLLLGHSDGASIALIHAGSPGRALAGVIAMAPHVMVEDVTIRGVAATCDAYRDTDLRERLRRHHDDVDSAFLGWSGIWLDPSFRSWNIEGYLPAIACPVLAIQGEDDEYGTMQQVERIARGARDVEVVRLAGCGHSPHRDRPAEVLAAVRGFVARLREGQGTGAAGEPGAANPI